MATGRVYYAHIDGVAVSAVADLFWFSCPTDAVVFLEEICITQDASETSEQLPLRLFRTTTDNAANGTGVTPAPLNVGDAAYGGTVRSNITGGSLSAETTPILSESQNILNGWHLKGSYEDPILVMTPAAATAGRAAIKLDAAPGASINVSGYIKLREIGG
jgi:hypothetical protein